MESTSEMETALQFYEAARDNLSLVRVYCYCGNLEKVLLLRAMKQERFLEDFLSTELYIWLIKLVGKKELVRADVLFLEPIRSKPKPIATSRA